MVHSRIFRK